MLFVEFVLLLAPNGCSFCEGFQFVTFNKFLFLDVKILSITELCYLLLSASSWFSVPLCIIRADWSYSFINIPCPNTQTLLMRETSCESK
jgi:hypothetical protein